MKEKEQKDQAEQAEIESKKLHKNGKYDQKLFNI